MTIEISQDDVRITEEFLARFLEENIEDGRFSEGTALRDLTARALAFIVAHIRKENRQIQSLQSLLRVDELAKGDPATDRTVASAVDAILSNWFITRKTGSFARGTLFIEVTDKRDYIIPINNRFSYDRSKVFFLDVDDFNENNVVIPSSSVIPNVSSDGTIESYLFKVRVIAARTGESYNVSPRTWSNTGGFSPFVIRAFNDDAFSGGGNREDTDTVIERSSKAIATRNLINDRSIDATLRERFSDIKRVLTIGMGEPEMQRDQKSDLNIHLGGHYDIYCDLPVSEKTFEGQVGGRFARPDGIANVFKDDTVSDWTALNIRIGDVIRVAAGLPEAPRDYTIKEIFEHELRISENTPFSAATEDTSDTVSYFIYRPIFGADVRLHPSSGAASTGYTSRYVQTDNRVLLPGGPHYDISSVEVIDPDAGDSFIDAGDGYVHIGERVNETPSAAALASELEYQVINTRPETAQSQVSLEEVVVESKYNNKTLRITYETLPGFNVIHNYSRDRFERISAANPLVRAFFPVYLSFSVPYKLKKTASDVVDEEELEKALAAYINEFDPRNIIDVSDVSNQVRNFDSNIGAVFPFVISYYLIAPDGRLIFYETEDEVVVSDDKLAAGSDELSNPSSYSLSDRTIKYITSSDRVSVERQ